MIEYADEKYNEQEFKNMVFKILVNERGALSYTTIYEVTKYRKSFIGALRGLFFGKAYYNSQIKTSRNLAKYTLNKYPPIPDEKYVYMG